MKRQITWTLTRWLAGGREESITVTQRSRPKRMGWVVTGWHWADDPPPGCNDARAWDEWRLSYGYCSNGL